MSILHSYSKFSYSTGASGSGKTYTSMLLLRQLFDVAGGGPETDAFKHLAAAFTVLRSLGSAKTTSNSESSRIVSIEKPLKSTVSVS
ncbi:hypothetical protein E2C01_092458 [Portunus trituberculatus]|uniref:Myosin motor domain-containing protein n=1 Tax=Portunus trituberculatus TaxID=210409 RepID=A0A5B7JRT3_PORTR|nr:hypothetical protein [Portunus trituberculatus]